MILLILIPKIVELFQLQIEKKTDILVYIMHKTDYYASIDRFEMSKCYVISDEFMCWRKNQLKTSES